MSLFFWNQSMVPKIQTPSVSNTNISLLLESKYGVENSNSLSFKYKKNSKNKTKNKDVKVDLKNKGNEFAPVVVAGDDQPGLPPAVIYATSLKNRDTPSLTLKTDRSDKSDEIEFFDPNEFETDKNISREDLTDLGDRTDLGDVTNPETLKSYYTNSTYDYDEEEEEEEAEEDTENKPSFLI